MNRLPKFFCGVFLLFGISKFLLGKLDLEALLPEGEAVMVYEVGLHEYHLDLFKVGKIPTERKAYMLLKNRPIKSINYLAVPWAHLVNVQGLRLIPNIRLQGGFTISQSIRSKRIIPILEKLGIDVLFTPHAWQEEKHGGVRVLPFPHYPSNGIKPAAKKDLWYSFIGYNSHWTRADIFKLPQQKKVIIKERQKWFSQKSVRKKNEKKHRRQELTEYKDVLSRSRFSLCPRGTGLGSIRFWESLQAGAIPVLIADGLALPQEVNWDECIIKIPEKEVHTINEVLGAISLEQEQVMRKNCLRAYRLLCEGENFVNTIRNYYVTVHDNA